MDALTIGPRQTVTRVRHPKRGEGLAVYRNGPSFFVPDGGEPVVMGVEDGGASSGPPTRCWMYLTDAESGRVEADNVPTKEGDPTSERHDRAWSPLLGAGWLVWGKGWLFRFESDAGPVAAFTVRAMAVGTPDYAGRSKRSRASKVLPMTDEEVQWTTYETSDAGTLGFRCAPPGEFPRKNYCPAPPSKAGKGGAKSAATLPGVH